MATGPAVFVARRRVDAYAIAFGQRAAIQLARPIRTDFPCQTRPAARPAVPDVRKNIRTRSKTRHLRLAAFNICLWHTLAGHAFLIGFACHPASPAIGEITSHINTFPVACFLPAQQFAVFILTRNVDAKSLGTRLPRTTGVSTRPAMCLAVERLADAITRHLPFRRLPRFIKAFDIDTDTLRTRLPALT